VRSDCPRRLDETVATGSIQNVGITTFSPFFNADSWAQMPTMVQLAEVAGVGEGGAVALDGAQPGVDEVRVRAAVSAALDEREVRLALDVVHALGREPSDRLGEEPGEIGHGDARGDLGLGLAQGVDDGLLALDLLQLEALLAAVGVEALAVLPGRVEQAASHLGADVAVLEFERGRLDRERAAVLGDQGFVDPPRAVAYDVLGVLAEDRQARADAVRGVVHRRQALPVARPAGHVLLVAAAEELDPAEFARVVEFFDEQIFTTINNRLHHHVDLARLPLRGHDLAAVLDRGRHRHGAGDVLARLERGDRLPGVVGDRGVDVDGVDLGVLEDVGEVGVARGDLPAVAALVEVPSSTAGRSRGFRPPDRPDRSG